MRPAKTRAFRKLGLAALLAGCGAMLGACTSTPATTVKSSKRSKEYFAESVYGVKASPRVTSKRSRLPRGGGRDQLGKPYKVKGKWYYPKEQPNYRAVGMASWYGDAFHGRLTANGEVYDMTHLTAAHPTMPLPSYARVTNTVNGSSVIVRVNDRGPFERGRVIDLSKRAAELLDYTHSGVAKVEVEYVGRAPLEGQDDSYLMASYRPGRGAAPEETIATGVMIAMAGPTPTVQAPAAAFPGRLETVAADDAQPEATLVAFADVGLPELGPIVPERPFENSPGIIVASADLMSYVDMRVWRASEAFSAFDRAAMSPADVVASFERGGRTASQGNGDHVAIGTFAGEAEAGALARLLGDAGRVETTIEADGAEAAYTVNLHPDGRLGLDDMLRKAWALGASDAFVVRQ